MLVREVHLYTEKIREDDIKNLFNQIVKSRLPLFGIFDFSDIFSPYFAKLIITRQNNTIRFFLKEKASLASLSALVFPFRLSEPVEFNQAEGFFTLPPRFFFITSSHDFLDFMLKENVVELHLYLSRMLGSNIGLGSAIDEKGKKMLIFVSNPSKFMLIDLEKNPSIYIELLEPIPKRMSTTSKYPVFEETGMTLGTDNFDVFQHTIIVGASGTGKTKCFYILLKAIEALHKDNVRMLVLDPHGEFVRMLHDKKIVNFVDNYVEPLEMGGQKTPLLTQLIAQLISSSIGQENKYSERVLFYSVHLLTELDKLTLTNISALLTDSAARAEFVSASSNDEVKRFFDEEFNDIYIHHFNDAVLPILNFVGEYQLYLGKEMKKESLLDLLKNNRVTVVSFDPHFFGKRMISFLAGAIINQMYILAITGKLQEKPTILAIDEFPRVENKVAKDILIETRKFNLYLYLSMQYLNQLSKEVYDAIIGNVRNIIAFKLSRQDATSISSIMEIKIEEFFKKNRTQTELEESKKEMFVRLHQRECIVRLFDGRTYLIPMKVKVVDMARWGWTDEMDKKSLMLAAQMEEKRRQEAERLKKLKEDEAAKQAAKQEEQPQQQPEPAISEPIQEPLAESKSEIQENEPKEEKYSVLQKLKKIKESAKKKAKKKKG
ncbi:MAG: type IV secretion system DNA-binding domain-containing protein [Candidatus Anstonellaceae archaeon]